MLRHFNDKHKQKVVVIRQVSQAQPSEKCMVSVGTETQYSIFGPNDSLRCAQCGLIFTSDRNYSYYIHTLNCMKN